MTRLGSQRVAWTAAEAVMLTPLRLHKERCPGERILAASRKPLTLALMKELTIFLTRPNLSKYQIGLAAESGVKVGGASSYLLRLSSSL